MRSALLASLLLVLGLLLGSPATAAPQPVPPKPSPPATATPDQPAPAEALPPGEGAPTTAPDAAPASSVYQQHMDNGVKLFRDQNYAAAIAEFEAAYHAEPKASPLINLALSYKKLFDYPKAIEVLHAALTKHADTMKPEYREAAEREVRELEALLAWLRVQVRPKEAKLFVDDQVVEGGRLGGEIALSPGVHQLRAEAEGYRTAEQRVQLVSGHGNPPVSLKLEATTGDVTVTATHAKAWIEVDGKKLGRGKWQGKLPPGVHAVRVLRDDEAHGIEIVVQAGGRALVLQNEEGALESAAAAPAQGDHRKGFGPEVPELLRGLYAMGGGSMLVPLVQVPGYQPSGQYQPGGAGALYLGYRVADWAGFELFFQGGDVRLDLDAATESPMALANRPTASTRLTLRSIRVAPLLRIIAPTHTMVRFVGQIGGGIAIDWLRWAESSQLNIESEPEAHAGAWDRYDKVSGAINGMVELDLGAEVEISRVLLALMVQNTFQSTKGFDQESGQNPLDGHPMLLVGPSARIGYALW